jgi:hypothetical protein
MPAETEIDPSVKDHNEITGLEKQVYGYRYATISPNKKKNDDSQDPHNLQSVNISVIEKDHKHQLADY